VDAQEESQDVVDEFFSQANSIADAAGTDVKERKRQLKIYEGRRKNQAADGNTQGLNNW